MDSGSLSCLSGLISLVCCRHPEWGRYTFVPVPPGSHTAARQRSGTCTLKLQNHSYASKLKLSEVKIPVQGYTVDRGATPLWSTGHSEGLGERAGLTGMIESSEDNHLPKGRGLLDGCVAVWRPGYRLEQISLLRIFGKKKYLTSLCTLQCLPQSLASPL